MKVAFYKGRERPFNRIVSWWLRGYSHCELVLSTDAAGISQCISSSFMDGGVRIKFMALDPDHWDLVEVPVAPGARAWFDQHAGQPYDVLGLVGFVWRRQRGRRGAWFCSEAIGAMLGWPQPWRLDPQILYCALTAPVRHELGAF